jgi:hypothetical protein
MHESVPGSPWRHDIDGSISGMGYGEFKVYTGAGNTVQCAQSRTKIMSIILIE